MDPTGLTELRRQARAADELPRWAERSWEVLRQLGALRWAVPAAYGGDGLGGSVLLERYEALAGACLTSCFLLSQRDAACRRLVDSASEWVRRELFPRLATGEGFLTVGLAQLTTSRQYGKPAVTARADGDAFILNGTVPWVTGAPRAEHIVTGAVLDDGTQIVAALPMSLAGVTVGASLELIALQGSMTAEVRLDGVRLGRNWLLAGPAAQVMHSGRGGTGGLETSCLAFGLAGAALGHLREESAARPDLVGDAEKLDHALHALRQQMYQQAAGAAALDPQGLRTRANSLVLRATQAALVASKGTGFLRSHPAQRWARQALFFLVWSCPRPVAAAALASFTEQVCP